MLGMVYYWSDLQCFKVEVNMIKILMKIYIYICTNEVSFDYLIRHWYCIFQYITSSNEK